VIGRAATALRLCGALALASGCGSVAPGSDGGLVDATPTPGAPGAIEVAPYFYSWGVGSASYAFGSLAAMQAQGGPAAVSLAFVISDGSCNASGDLLAHLADVRAYRAAGGQVKASFGGASGTYLEAACATAGALAGALGRFVDDTGITDLDFDLEQGTRSSTAALNQLRGDALAQLQAARSVRISFSLPIAPAGVLPESLDILRAALAAGVRITRVNGLTMDYGNGTDLGTTPSTSIDGLAQQLRGLDPQLTLAQAYRLSGATAMIGKNDDDEVFSLDNARSLVAYAKAKQLGLLSFWAIQRDQPCGSDNDIALCSGLNTSTFQFSEIFESVNATP
jgi:chitinase